MNQPVRRRGPGRPRTESAAPVSTQPVIVAESQQADAPADPTVRRRRASVGGHALKLSAPQRPGWTRRWFNDEGNRIAEAEELGYSPVSDAGIKTSAPGSVVSRLTGTQANGQPLHSILMETPDELYAEGVAEKEAHNRLIDDAITSGRDSTGQMSPTETYGHGSIKSDR